MLGAIKAALNDIDGNAAMDELNATGALKLDVNGQEIELFKEDLLIDTAQIEGYESVNDNGITVVLDTNLCTARRGNIHRGKAANGAYFFEIRYAVFISL